MSIQPKDSGGGSGETRESVVTRQADDMLEKLPNDYIPHEVRGACWSFGQSFVVSLQLIECYVWRATSHMSAVVPFFVLVRSFLTSGESATPEDGSSGFHEHFSEARDRSYAACDHLGPADTDWPQVGYWRDHHHEWSTPFFFLILVNLLSLSKYVLFHRFAEPERCTGQYVRR